METQLNFRDLFLRLIVIYITSVVLLFLTEDDRFDLHFKIRKSQETSPRIVMVELPTGSAVEPLLETLEKKNVGKVLFSQFISEIIKTNVSPYAIGDSQPQMVNLDFKPDADGLLRHVFVSSNPLFPEAANNKKLTLNFRGPNDSFPSLHYYDLADSPIHLENKMIIIKSTRPIRSYTTPVGLIDEAELVATYLDNHLEQRFIPKKNFVVPALILLFLLLLTTGFLLYLPSSLALLTSGISIVVYISLSLWFFDTFYYWTPILVPCIQVSLTLLLISNYKYVLNEKTRWKLEKESAVSHQMEEMKTNFLSLFSHDLKTPLAKIIGIVDRLKSQSQKPEEIEELEKIYQSSKELEKYIKRILKMSQVQSKNISLNKEPADINQLIKQSIDQNKLIAQQKKIKIDQRLSPLFMIEIDAPLIQEVLVNFIENAITYSPDNTEVLVQSEEIDDFIKVSVRDQGPGIPQKSQDQIWEKSYRLNSDHRGYGLGLFLSRYVVELHGGQVFLNSKENQGSEFGFLLPLKEDIS
jgi:two-component system phosphate regulon sensor histidine kinase PhoR